MQFLYGHPLDVNCGCGAPGLSVLELPHPPSNTCVPSVSLPPHPWPPFLSPDSAWAVYIMPEEVGTRCHMIGIHILLLRGGVPHQSVGRLEILSPTDAGKPVVVWDRDKMRRTGKTGNLVFIEIGRRCRGGPGLVWMYAGFEEAHPLRETLHRLACFTQCFCIVPCTCRVL